MVVAHEELSSHQKAVSGQRSLSLATTEWLFLRPSIWFSRAKRDGEDEWRADMSKILIRNKFAAGWHSRIYNGIYKEREVTVKDISQPEENAKLTALLKQQFH